MAIEHTDAAIKSMIELDPPDHTQMRKLIARRFTPRRIAELEPRVREWTNALLDRLDGRDEFDVVHEFTALLPTTVVGTMLGIPADRHDDARQWTDDLLTREPGNPVPPPAAAEGAMQIAVLAHQLAAARRERPADDILSTLVEAEIDGAPLTDQQVIGFCLLLITGGHETTSKLIANGIRLFASHPDQRDHAASPSPTAWRGAVEELLRYTSPTQYMARTTTRPVALHGSRDARRGEGAAAARLGQPRPARVRPARRVRHHARQPAHPRLRSRRARVPRRGGGAARDAHRAARSSSPGTRGTRSTRTRSSSSTPATCRVRPACR